MLKKNLLTFTLFFILISFLIITLIIKNKAQFFSTTRHQVHEIILDENGFTPSEIEIKPGDSIRFTTTLNEPFWPASDLHPTHGIYPEFDPLEPIEPSNSWTFQFLKTGKWKYHDHLQPIFRGIILVQPYKIRG